MDDIRGTILRNRALLRSLQCIPVSWTKAKAIPVKLFMISTGFPERSNTLSPSLSIYIYIDFEWRRRKEREKEGNRYRAIRKRSTWQRRCTDEPDGERAWNVCGEESPKPASFPLIQQWFNSDVLFTAQKRWASMGGCRPSEKKEGIEEGLETDWPEFSHPPFAPQPTARRRVSWEKNRERIKSSNQQVVVPLIRSLSRWNAPWCNVPPVLRILFTRQRNFLRVYMSLSSAIYST